MEFISVAAAAAAAAVADWNVNVSDIRYFPSDIFPYGALVSFPMPSQQQS